MEDGFVRFVNEHSRKFVAPFPDVSSGSHRAFVNEAAFRLFEQHGMGCDEVTNEQVLAAFLEASAFVGRLIGSPLTPSTMTYFEGMAIRELARRLVHFFYRTGQYGRVWLRPRFQGCGILSACDGDVLADTTLFEVKAGLREFRVPDFRQLITYCSLNMEANRYQIENIGVINPRLGTYYILSLKEFALSVAGVNVNELSARVLDFLSAQGTSR